MAASTNKAKIFFEKFSGKATSFTGSTTAFSIALLIVIVWGVTGPLFNYSETWQLVINTGTTIITFLMVFLIQKSQNKDSLAIQLKLNELVASHKGASNRLIDVECLSEDDLKVLQSYYKKLSELAKKARNLKETHSIEDAEELHREQFRNSHEKPVKA